MEEKLFGNYPYTPTEKKPCHIKGDKIISYLAPFDHLYQSDLNKLYASTDKITVGIFHLAPGSSYDPADVHDGDETYYVLQGTLTVQNTVTGEFVQVKKGEGLFMPTYTYHKGYNFEQEELKVLFAIAPRVLPGDLMIEDFSNGRMNQYKNPFNDSFTFIPPFEKKYYHGTTDMIGKWPISGPESRKEPLMFYHVAENNKLINVVGKDHPMLMKFIVSNDLMHMGEFILPAGGSTCRASEIDQHRGDCVLFVESGPAIVYISATRDAYEVHEGEAMLIPENTPYQIFNYSSKSIKLIFSISTTI